MVEVLEVGVAMRGRMVAAVSGQHRPAVKDCDGGLDVLPRLASSVLMRRRVGTVRASLVHSSKYE